MSVIGRAAPFLMSASGAFSPLSLFAGGEKGGWYEPSDLSTVFQDTSGTTPAGVGDPVGRISDKSGNGYHLTQATSGNRPLLAQDGSGNYYLDPDGTNDFLSNASVVFATAEFYLIAGFMPRVQTNSNERLFGSLGAGGGDFGSYAVTTGIFRNGTAASWGGLRNSITAVKSLSNNTLAVIEVINTATGITAALNGGADTTTTYTATNFNATKISLFANSQNGTENCTSRFYGGIALNRALTTQERASAVAYINSKTGAF